MAGECVGSSSQHVSRRTRDGAFLVLVVSQAESAQRRRGAERSGRCDRSALAGQPVSAKKGPFSACVKKRMSFDTHIAWSSYPSGERQYPFPVPSVVAAGRGRQVCHCWTPATTSKRTSSQAGSSRADVKRRRAGDSRGNCNRATTGVLPCGDSPDCRVPIGTRNSRSRRRDQPITHSSAVPRDP